MLSQVSTAAAAPSASATWIKQTCFSDCSSLLWRGLVDISSMVASVKENAGSKALPRGWGEEMLADSWEASIHKCNQKMRKVANCLLLSGCCRLAYMLPAGHAVDVLGP